MIEKIARDVSNKLNTTISKDFEGMVGIEAHLKKIQSLLQLDFEDEAMIVGICGPSGIGKTTIARALHSRLSSSFKLTCFMDNIRGCYNSGLDEYGLKLRLQKKLLSKTLNQNGMRIFHLGTIPERLCDQNVLIILDDVDDLKQLEALAKETNWFGPGSRIIITTKDQEVLEKHGINFTYHVDFPTKEEARKILCKNAFRLGSPPDGFEKLVERVTELCSNLPLGLRVIGSTLLRKNEDDWGGILRRLENSLDRDIDGVLRVGYDNLHKDDQHLFLLIAFFFNYKDDDHVKTMLADFNLDVRLGLKTLAYKSIIQISAEREIVMHKLLQQMGREAVQRQDPGKRQILIDKDEIREGLENGFPLKYLKKMSLENSVYLEELPDLSNATNLEILNLNQCFRLVEIPSSFGNLHKLKHLDMKYCIFLQTIPTHINLASLETVNMVGCCSLRRIPDISRNITTLYIKDKMLQNLSESIRLWSRLQILRIGGSDAGGSKLAKVFLKGSGVDIEEIPDCIKDLNGLKEFYISGCPKIASLPELPSSLERLIVEDCRSLETLVSSPFHSQVETCISNCLKLDQEAFRVIRLQSRAAWLPGKNVPVEFNHQAIGNSLIIPSRTTQIMMCIVLSPKHQMNEYARLLCRQTCNGFPSEENILLRHIPKLKTEHLFICPIKLRDEMESEVLFEFNTTSKDMDIIECGFKIFDRLNHQKAYVAKKAMKK